MTIFELIAAIATFLAACYTAYKIGADLNKSAKQSANLQINLPIKNIEDELNLTRLMVFQRDAKKRQKLRQAAKSRNRVKGRFA